MTTEANAKFIPDTSDVRGAYHAWNDGQGDRWHEKPTWSFEEFDRWLADHDAAVLEKWAAFQDSVLTGPLAYAVEDSDRAEVARWTRAVRAYAAGLRRC